MEEVNMEPPSLIRGTKIILQKSNGTTQVETQKDKYIAKDETEELTEGAYRMHQEMHPVYVDLRRVSANWISGQLPPTLCNISMTIKPGELCALVGAVGSGKSSVLHLLLRELNPGAGSIVLTQTSSETVAKSKLSNGYFTDNLNLRISYASQEAWLFGGTVRDNILFGQPYDKIRYVQVSISCCACHC
jgi:ATP-binding cassette subfamily C (CFTR/MRP) protein 4